MPKPPDFTLSDSTTRDASEGLVSLLVECATILFLVIHMQALISLPLKLNGGSPVPGSGLIWLTGALIGLGLAALMWRKLAPCIFLALPFLVLCAWAFASSRWSENPFDTMKSSIYMFASLAGACALSLRYSWEGILARLTLAIGILVVVSVLLAIAMPSIGRMHEVHVGAWSGVWMEKQAMGMYASLLILTTICLVLANPRYKLALWLIPLGYLAILGTTGKTALLMSVLGVGVLGLGWLIQRGPRLALLTLWSSLAIGGPLIYVIVAAPDLVFQILGRSSDLTGRTEIWREVGYLIDRQPMTGYGFTSVWKDQQSPIAPYQWIAEGTGFLPQNAHSSWLDAQLQLGLPGLGLVILCVVTAWIAAACSLRRGGPGALFALSALSTITLISFTETILMASMDLPWFLVALISVKLLDELRRGALRAPTATWAQPAAARTRRGLLAEANPRLKVERQATYVSSGLPPFPGAARACNDTEVQTPALQKAAS